MDSRNPIVSGRGPRFAEDDRVAGGNRSDYCRDIGVRYLHRTKLLATATSHGAPPETATFGFIPNVAQTDLAARLFPGIGQLHHAEQTARY